MPLENLILVAALLLVAMLAGWWLGRRRTRRVETGSGGINRDYFKGLNYLLNERPDDALDVFIRMAELDSDTIETHFTLGSLFRRRGEVDRAIRIHQNLIARPNLSRRHRTQALAALGDDYMKAGLLDRAESLFAELTRDRQQGPEALQKLLVIYEQQKDWDRAIQVARDLESRNGSYRSHEIAHYYCELAELALQKADFNSTARFLRKAGAFDRGNVRVQLLSAQLAEKEQKWRHAIRHYKRALEADPAQASTQLAAIHAVLQHQNKLDQFESLVDSVSRSSPEARRAIALAALRLKGIHSAALDRVVETFLAEAPGLEGVREAVKRFVKLSKTAADIQEQNLIRQLLREWRGDSLQYSCDNCGYSGSVLYWQCPSCRSWETLRPRLELNVSAS
ncbi:MAG: lipopolysaccharide assembly protein LapB [Gammaproteobacteria bacterium]|nr:lipopolysaccharide assembly protein LapB [Gammaproteobacteria bacterium]